jgi:hypothetical protein
MTPTDALPALRELSVEHNGIGDKGLLMMMDAPCRPLLSLNLNQNSVSEETARALLRSPLRRALSSLRVSNALAQRPVRWRHRPRRVESDSSHPPTPSALRLCQAPVPMGQLTPVPPSPQYPPGFLCRYCWWYSDGAARRRYQRRVVGTDFGEVGTAFKPVRSGELPCRARS